MISREKGLGGYNLIFCVLAAFLPLGSNIGVLFSWGVFPVLAVLITLYYTRSMRLEGVFVFLVIVILLSINYFITIQYIDYTIRVNKNICLALIGCFYFIVCFYSESFTLRNLNKAITVALVVNFIFFMLQFLMYYIGNFYLDYGQMTGGEGGRNFSNELFRASGIFSEPAEYCSAMICLVSIKYFIEKSLSRFSLLILITVMLSFSVIGLIQAIAFLFIANFRKIYKRPLNLILFCLICFTAFLIFKDYLFERYDLFILGQDGSNNTKIDTISFFIDNKSYLYGGAGLMGYDLYSMPLFFQGLYDLTFWGANVTIFGLILGLVINFAFFLFLLLNFNAKKIGIILICLLKINVMIYASYWFFIFSLIILARDKTINSSGH